MDCPLWYISYAIFHSVVINDAALGCSLTHCYPPKWHPAAHSGLSFAFALVSIVLCDTCAEHRISNNLYTPLFWKAQSYSVKAKFTKNPSMFSCYIALVWSLPLKFVHALWCWVDSEVLVLLVSCTKGGISVQLGVTQKLVAQLECRYTYVDRS